MEKWDIYDVNMQKTGQYKIRGEEIEKGEYHLVVGVCIFNNEGQMLIQQRQKDKDGWPGMWDITAAGSAVSGETSSQAAQRELFEEMGIAIDFSDKRPIISVGFERGFTDYYCIEHSTPIESLVLQKEEVQNAKWADIKTIFEMIDAGSFIPYYKSLITALFDMRNAKGSFIY
ncbi:MAG: NUDIX domain-containing protein [Clostridia bacterium]|nr:NUDIX domain-containing protein [Clostridia bacterium]